MGQKFTFNSLWIILIAVAVSINIALASPAQPDTTLFRLRSRTSLKPSYLRSGLKTNFPQFKPATAVVIKPATKPVADDKLLSNVQVYPNPIVDQINLKYTVARNTNVSIKILDVLGNNVATLFSQRVEPGEQKFTYYLNNKLTSGFYFVRIVVGTESVIKRISIL